MQRTPEVWGLGVPEVLEGLWAMGPLCGTGLGQNPSAPGIPAAAEQANQGGGVWIHCVHLVGFRSRLAVLLDQRLKSGATKKKHCAGARSHWLH